MQTISIGMLAFGLQDILWPPKAGDVVVDFFLGWNFNQVNRALAPVSDRLGPQAWPLFEIRLDILICKKILLPLHHAETARVEIGKDADLQIFGIAKRAPKLLTSAVEN